MKSFESTSAPRQYKRDFGRILLRPGNCFTHSVSVNTITDLIRNRDCQTPNHFWMRSKCMYYIRGMKYTGVGISKVVSSRKVGSIYPDEPFVSCIWNLQTRIVRLQRRITPHTSCLCGPMHSFWNVSSHFAVNITKEQWT